MWVLLWAVLVQVYFSESLADTLNSSPQRQCKQFIDVAIIGAGPAGAYSAYKLREKNLSVAVFEHSDRIGGRLFTARLDNVPDQNIELGGMRYVEHDHVLVEELVKDLNLESRVFLSGVDSTFGPRVFKRKVSMTKEEFKTGDVPYDLTEEEKLNQKDLLGYLFRKLTNDSLNNVTVDNIFDLTVPDGRKLYTLSVQEAIGLVASPEAVKYLLDDSHFDSQHIAATDLLYYELGSHGQLHTGGQVLTLLDGLSSIPQRSLQEFIAASPRHSVNMNHRLRSIWKMKDGIYKLSFMKTKTVDGVTTDIPSSKAREIVCARKVILAMPKYALKQVKWNPVRSERYRRLLNGTVLIHASKVFMTFERPWWQEDSLYPATHVVASDLGEIYTWGQSAETGDHTLLVSYTKMIDTDKQFAFNNGLDEYFPDSLDDIEHEPSPPPTVSTVKGDQLPPLLRFSMDLDPINGSVSGENRVTEPLKNYLFDNLSEVFGVPRKDIPESKSSIVRFWIRYPFGGGWVFTRRGYRFDELPAGYRRPSAKDDVFVVGSDFAGWDLTGWTEGALTTAKSVIDEFF